MEAREAEVCSVWAEGRGEDHSCAVAECVLKAHTRFTHHFPGWLTRVLGRVVTLGMEPHVSELVGLLRGFANGITGACVRDMDSPVALTTNPELTAGLASPSPCTSLCPLASSPLAVGDDSLL
jgi:hypothetical protein